MIALDKLQAVKVIFTHDHCADGLTSAILLKDAFFGKDIPIKFLLHGTEEFKTLQPEPGMLFCDIAPPIVTKEFEGKYVIAEGQHERLQGFIDAGAIILDHHKTARPIVEAFGDNGVFGDEIANPGVCGAYLAYQHVWLPFREQLAVQAAFAKKFAILAGIRDTWQRTDARWKEACLQHHILKFVPTERWMAKTLTEIASTWNSQYAWIGDLLQEKQDRTVQKIIGQAFRFTSQAGTRVVVFEGLHMSSDVAEAIHEGADLIVAFNYSVEDGTPKMLCSTRSHTHFDCSALAVSQGGGGHTKAAGFNFKMVLGEGGDTNPFDVVQGLVHKWESRKNL